MRSVWLTANSHSYVRSGSQPTEIAPSQGGSQPRWLPAKMAPSQDGSQLRWLPAKMAPSQDGSQPRWLLERWDSSDLSISRNDKKCPPWTPVRLRRGMRIFRLRECGAGAWRGGDVGYDSRSLEEMQMGGHVYVTSVCLRVCSYVCVCCNFES